MKKSTKYVQYIFGITILQFFAFHNISSLNPLNHDWFFHSGDLSSMLIGQIYFLQQENFFSIPLGLVNNYAGEWCGNLIKFEVPVILFTKVIYILCKYFGLNIPLDIQFFGLFNLVNMFLLNYFLLKILMIWSPKQSMTIILLSVLIISSSPYILFRNLIFHFNLASYWIIAASIYLSIQPVKEFWRWVLLTFLAGIIHPYLIPFPTIMWAISSASLLRSANYSFGYCFKIICQSSILLASLITPILLLSGLWLKSGQFHGTGLGTHHSNLLSIIDSNGFSSFIKNIPTLNDKNGDYEGYAYIGLGSIFILIAAFLSVLRKKIDFKMFINNNLKLIIGSTIFFLLSTGGVIAIGTHELISIQFNDFIFKTYSIYRSSGRFIVFSIIVLQLISIFILYKSMGEKHLLIFLAVAFAFQIYDEKKLILEIRLRDSTVANKRGEHIINQINWSMVSFVEFIVPENSHYEWKMSLIYPAAMRGVPTNDAFCGRSDDKRLYKMRGDIEQKIISNKEFNARTLYVTYPDKEFVNPPANMGWIKIPYLDGSNLIAHQSILQ